MFKYIKKLYKLICDRFDFLYTVNLEKLQIENDYYCKMTDGGFLIKDVVPKTKEERIQVYR